MKIAEVAKLPPLERLLYWVRERESVRLKKESKRPWPWTDDELLQRYRFCNVRRMDDKVSRWLLKSWYEPFYDHINMLYAVALARFINLPSSLVGLSAFLFEGEIDWKQVRTYIKSARSDGPVFNSAYMVRCDKGIDKIDYVIERCVQPLGGLPGRDSMENVWETLVPRYGYGSFMAGQIVADLRWAVTGGWRDKDSWAPHGPGSLRGMNRLMGRRVREPCTALWPREFPAFLAECRRNMSTDLTSRLEAIDYQNTLCEWDKYERALQGQGRPKRRYP